MLRRNLPMLVAVGASLVVHGLFIGGTTKVRVAPALLPESREERVAVVVLGPNRLSDDGVRPEPQVLPPEAAPDKEKAPDAPPKPDSNKPEEQPPKPKPPKVDRFPDLIGDMKGKGIGTHDAEGDQPLKAREADADQPFLSRDPRGPGRIGNDPSLSQVPPGEGGTGGSPARAASPEMASGGPASPVQRVPSPAAPDSASLPPPPAPAAKPSKSDQSAQQTPAPSLVRLPSPAPVGEVDPGVHLGPLLLLPKPAAKQAFVGKTDKPGRGDAGAADELTLSNGDSGTLPPRVERPSATPGKTEGVASPTPIPVPRVAPPRSLDEPAPEAAKPKVALLLVPAAQPSFTAAPPGPTASVPTPPGPPAPPAPPAPAPRPNPPVPTAAELAAPSPSNAPAALSPSPPASPGDGRKPGPTTPAADPAQASDSESDPFARIGSADLLRDGKLEVQFGRKVKTVRPRVPLVGQIDAFAMRNPSVTLKVNIDPTGKVTHVTIHKSSGSNEIDQPCLIAMYEWWFEPLKDKSGKPIPDTLLFTIGFR